MNSSTALWEYLQDSAKAPFAWGEHDCVLWVARWLDLRARHIGQPPRYQTAVATQFLYHNEAEAIELLREVGSLQAAVEEVLGPIQPPLCLGEGDVALVFDGQQHGLGLRTRHQVVVLRKGGGVTALPLEFVLGGWLCLYS